MDTAVVWFRDDLRLADNPTLTAAATTATEIVPLYVIDPRHRGESQYGTKKLAPHRGRFRRESLEELRTSLRDRGGELVVRQGHAEKIIPELVRAVDADAVFAQTKPATEEKQAENNVQNELPEGVQYESRWTHTLYHIDDLPVACEQITDTFTPWRKTVEKEGEVRPTADTPSTFSTPPIDPGEIPTLAALGVDEPPTDDRAVLDFEGGETAGRERLEDYIWTGDHLREYKQTRNGLLGADYSSKFSPWLAAGCLSPRSIYEEIKQYEDERVANDDTYWLVFELLWRDFFQFQFEKHGSDFFDPTGIREVDKSWDRDRGRFEKWAAGRTGIPFVDANMRELNRTGYMSNRGRQNVASFLADALQIDWRWGAAYFEAQLVDYDVASN